jgi:hypothetical protein
MSQSSGPSEHVQHRAKIQSMLRTRVGKRLLHGVPAHGDALKLRERGREEEEQPEVALDVLELVELSSGRVLLLGRTNVGSSVRFVTVHSTTYGSTNPCRTYLVHSRGDVAGEQGVEVLLHEDAELVKWGYVYIELRVNVCD